VGVGGAVAVPLPSALSIGHIFQCPEFVGEMEGESVSEFEFVFVFVFVFVFEGGLGGSVLGQEPDGVSRVRLLLVRGGSCGSLAVSASEPRGKRSLPERLEASAMPRKVGTRRYRPAA
jgi:hypothetical protein